MQRPSKCLQDMSAFYRPQTKLREGNVFTHVCHFVHDGGVVRMSLIVLTHVPSRGEGVWLWRKGSCPGGTDI